MIKHFTEQSRTVEIELRLVRACTYLLLLAFFVGCANKPQVPLQVESLEEMLSSLSADANESKKLSSKMLSYSSQLGVKYRLVKPPLFHNFLVNTGVKERGLCWHFAYDMLSYAKEQNLKSFDYYIGGANIDDYWEEHNTLVVTCRGCEFKKGVVLDPWRDSGNLYYSYVKDDKKYIWTQRGGLR